MRSRTRLSSRYRRAPTARTPTTQTVNQTPPSTPMTIRVTPVHPVNWERSRKAKKAEKGWVSISKTGWTLWSAASHRGWVPSIGSTSSHFSRMSQLDSWVLSMATGSLPGMALRSSSRIKPTESVNSAPANARRKHTATVAHQLRRNCRFPRRLISFRFHISVPSLFLSVYLPTYLSGIISPPPGRTARRAGAPRPAR